MTTHLHEPLTDHSSARATAPSAPPGGGTGPTWSSPSAHGRVRVADVGAGTGGSRVAGHDEVLTPGALEFLVDLHDRFDTARRELLSDRLVRQQELEAGRPLDFDPATASIRQDLGWQVAPPPADLVNRRVEIAGPADRGTAREALASDAQVWIADLEDMATPHWAAVVGGQLTLRDAVRGHLSPAPRRARLHPARPTLVVRSRGLHLDETHLLIDGRPASAAFTDVGLFLFHNATELVARGSGPYLYLPKLEHHREARLWDDLFRHAQDLLGLPVGTIRATVLVETVQAAFQMEEMLHELREHSAGLSAGRWDYIHSVITTYLHAGPDHVLPDRSNLGMTVPFLRAYTGLLVRTCHQRGAHALGGMSSWVPSDDGAQNRAAVARVRADKRREAFDGFDGSWVAHPKMVRVVQEVFDSVLGGAPNQVTRLREDLPVPADGLLDLCGVPGGVTRTGLQTNVRVALRYLTAWLGGVGAVPIDGMVEDTSTAQISLAQLRQWVHHRTVLRDGAPVTTDLVRDHLALESAELTAGLAGSAPSDAGVDDGVDEGLPARVEQARALIGWAVTDPSHELFTRPAPDPS